MKGKKIMAVITALQLTVSGSSLASAAAAGTNEYDFLNDRSPINEPYDYVSGGSFSGEEIEYSPDPLVSYRWDDPKADDELQIFVRKPVFAKTETPHSFSGLESAASDNVDITVNGTGTIVVDFGREFAGWLEIDSPDLNGQVKMGTSEYNRPSFQNVGAQNTNKTQRPRKYGGTYRLELNSELYEGVRFGFIHVNSLDKPFHITDIRLVCQTKPANYNGSFESDNEMLNKIWYTAAYDVRANLRKDYFAAILNDRGDRFSWTGDAYPAQAAALVAFANYDFVLKNLRYTSTRGNGIESYEIYWVLSLIDYYEHTGDKDGLKSLLSQATSRLDHAYDIYGTNFNLHYYGWDERLGAGFENPNNEPNYEAYKMIAIRAWKEFAEILPDIGEDELAEKYKGYADEKTLELLSDPDRFGEYGIHAAADAINAGIVPDDVIDIIYEKYFTDRVNRLSYSPFNQYFILQAMSNSGNYDDGLSSVFDMYAGQIEYGGTTFFEVYRPQWNAGLETNGPVPNNQVGYTSLAHPWGAGVLTWLSEEVLGIKADEAGFDTFSVTPHLGRQLTRVSGEMPTTHGGIKASFDVEAGKASLTVPEGTSGRIGIPKAEKTIESVSLNGVPLEIAEQDEDFVYVNDLAPGEYEFDIEYSGETPEFENIEYEYAAEFVGTDTETKGNWGGVYGSDGYLLCNYDSSDKRALPDYINNVSFRLAKPVQWSANAKDERALAANSYNIGKRKIGAYHTDGVQPCAQSFTVDIDLKQPGEEYTVALYFVDWDRQGRQMAVDMFDGDTFDMAAPTKVIKDCKEGVYLIYKYNNSARFRINLVSGENAVLSGIFFGESNQRNEFSSSELLDDTDGSIVFDGSWERGTGFGDTNNGTITFSNVKGDSINMTFDGTGVAYIASVEQNRGIAEIFIDDKSYGKFDLYNERIRRNKGVFKISGLPDGTHTIRIEATGEKNEKATDCYVDVDAFEIISGESNVEKTLTDDQKSNVRYSGSGWQNIPFSGQNALNDTISFSNVKGDSGEFTFYGTGISWIGCKEQNRGIGKVYIDGEYQKDVDCYDPQMLRQQVLYTVDGLKEGEHTIKIEVSGEKNQNATDMYVDIDGFETRIYSEGTQTESVDDQSNSIIYSDNDWTSDPEWENENAYNDSITFSNKAGASAVLEFEGTGVSYIACTEPNRGIAQILLDGEPMGEFDCYSENMLRQQTIFSADDLPYGKHTIEIRVTGKKNENATDCFLDIDVIKVKSKKLSIDEIAQNIIIPSLDADDESIELPAMPDGYDIRLVSSSAPDVIALDGSVAAPDIEKSVSLVFEVTDGDAVIESRADVTVPGREHDWQSKYTVDLAPTCVLQGLESIHCAVCGIQKDITVIPPSGHDWEDEFTVDKQASCETEGLESIHCKVCDETKDERKIPAAGHDFGEWVIVKAATTVSDGLKQRTCKTCGFTDSAVLNKLTPAPKPQPSTPSNGVKDGILYVNGKAVTGSRVQKIGNTAYAVVNGKVATGSKTRVVTVGSYKYIVTKNGTVTMPKKRSVKTVSGKSYVVGTNGRIMLSKKQNKLYKAGTKSYVVRKRTGVIIKSKKGNMLAKIGNKWYVVKKKTGAVIKGKKAMTAKVGKKTYVLKKRTGLVMRSTKKALKATVKGRRYTIAKRTGTAKTA